MNDSGWRKSTRSQPDNTCVELRVGTGEFRDTKNRAAGSLKFSAAAFQAFLEQVKK